MYSLVWPLAIASKTGINRDELVTSRGELVDSIRDDLLRGCRSE